MGQVVCSTNLAQHLLCEVGFDMWRNRKENPLSILNFGSFLLLLVFKVEWSSSCSNIKVIRLAFYETPQQLYLVCDLPMSHRFLK